MVSIPKFLAIQYTCLSYTQLTVFHERFPKNGLKWFEENIIFLCLKIESGTEIKYNGGWALCL